MKKRVLVVIFILSFLGIVSLNSSVQAEENEDIFISNHDLRQSIYYTLGIGSTGLPTQKELSTLIVLETELLSPYANLQGIEYAQNLEKISGENDISLLDISPLKDLTQLKVFEHHYISNQINLTDLRKLSNLEILHFETDGYGSRSYEEKAAIGDSESASMYTRTLLRDISSLSNLKKLKEINIRTEGIISPVTLKKGATTYALYDPIILSSQFDNGEMSYLSGLDLTIQSDDSLEWQNLTGNEKYLSFKWVAKKGTFRFSGEGQIPIRWK